MFKFLAGIAISALVLVGVVSATALATSSDPSSEVLTQPSQTYGVAASDLFPDVAAATMENLTVEIQSKGCVSCVKEYAPDLYFNDEYGKGVVVFDGIHTLLVGEEFTFYWDGVQVGDSVAGPEAYGEGHIYTIVYGVDANQTSVANIHHTRQVQWCGASIGYCHVGNYASPAEFGGCHKLLKQCYVTEVVPGTTVGVEHCPLVCLD